MRHIVAAGTSVATSPLQQQREEHLDANDRPVNGPDGFYGTVNTTCWLGLDDKTQCDIDVYLQDGRHVTLPADLLIEQKDGSYYVPLHRPDLDALPHHHHGESPQDDIHWPCAMDPKSQ